MKIALLTGLEYQPRWSKSKADNLEDLIDFVGADKILIVGNSKDLGVKQIQTTDNYHLHIRNLRWYETWQRYFMENLHLHDDDN